MFFEFLVYIGIVNLVIGFIWPFPAFIIELLLGKLNHVLSHAVHRLLGTILLSMITVNIANYYSDSLLVFIIYCILGLLLNLSALLQAIGAIEKSSYNFSFDFMQRSKSNDRANFDYKYSVLFYPASFLIFIIFPFLTENVITENSFYFIDFVINIPFIGWIIPIIGGIVGVIFIPYALLMLWTTYIISNITDTANKEDNDEIKTEIKDKTFTEKEIEHFEDLRTKLSVGLPFLFIVDEVTTKGLNIDYDLYESLNDYYNELNEHFSLYDDELNQSYLDFLSFYWYADYDQFKTKDELNKHRIKEIHDLRKENIVLHFESFIEKIQKFKISMFHDKWNSYLEKGMKSKENPKSERNKIRQLIDSIISVYKTKFEEYEREFPSQIPFYINRDDNI